jgi:small-conductance mechanosensitive channel
MERGGIKRFFEQVQTQETPSSILGKIVFWFVAIIAITMAANALGIQQISGFLNQLIAFIPSIFAAVLILLLAGILANFVSGLVRGATGSGVLGSVAQYAIIIYAVFAALTQLGIAVELTVPTFLIVLGAVALGAAIAFGIGGREVAREIVEKAYNRHQKEDDSGGQGNGATDGSERPEARRLRSEEL